MPTDHEPAQMAKDLAEYVTTNQLDGVDLDYEHN